MPNRCAHAKPLEGPGRRDRPGGRGPAGGRLLVLLRARPDLGGRHDHRGRRGEPVRGRHRAGRREVRPGQRHHEQPEHGPAHVRGERVDRPPGQRGPARGAERPGLRHVHGHDREGGPRLRPPHDRGAEAARPAGQHAEPAPVVRPRHDAQGRRRDRRQPRRDPAQPRRLLQGQREDLHELAAPWINAIGSFKQHYPGTPVATTEPVADYLLQALGADNRTPVGLPGRRDERHRPVGAGRRDRAEPVHASTRSRRLSTISR